MSKRKVLESVENKQDSSESGSDSDTEISAYEQLRLKNIEERNRLLRNLGIDKAVKELNAVVPKPVKATPKKSTVRAKKSYACSIHDVPRREPSRRLRNLTPDGSVTVKEEATTYEEEEEKDKRLLGSLPMSVEDQESKDFFKILKNLKQEVVYDPLINLEDCSIERFQDTMRCLKMDQDPEKVVSKRIQSLLIHPVTTKKLIIAGSCSGHLGLWDLEATSVFEFQPHQAPTNCISVSSNDQSKLFSTSLDGTFVCADLESCLFTNVYATDFSAKVRHLTWHDQLDDQTFLICHGDGKVGVLDLRNSKKITWFPCFERSARTVQNHPTSNNCFLVSSGAGSSCNIYDIRLCTAQKAEPIVEMNHPKGLTSAFFSPSGDQVLSTCNDDFLRIYSVPDLTKATLKTKISHNNHTGRWLSVFKAIWHPSRNDAFLVGSLLYPRRIQIYSTNGKLISELRSEEMTTISPVLAAHAVLPIIAGGNSSGRIHAFMAPETKIEKC